MPLLRLDKIIADTGYASRSEAAALIKRGAVTVGGRPALSGADKFDALTAEIRINGNLIEYRQFRYVMMNKPQGYVSSTKDRLERTVIELLDERYRSFGLFPAGRLDKDAEGLLLLTNDGDFAHRITAPSKKVDKVYFVQLDGEITSEDAIAFAQGVVLGDGTKCLPAALETVQGDAYVTICEGKYHQVKRMFAAVGKQVLYLKRLSIGGLKLDESLSPGDYMEISAEIAALAQNK